MNMLRPFSRIFIGLVALLLGSCIDSHEEIWLEADGSGRGEVRLSVPAGAAILHGGQKGIRESIRKFLEATPELKDPSSSVEVRDGRMEIRLSASFDSALDLMGVPNEDAVALLPGSAEGLAGTVEVRSQGRSLELSRTIHASKSLPGSSLMPASRMKDQRLVYIVHLPRQPTESNATRTENEGRTLVWEYPLADAVKGPLTLRFKADVPLPRWLLASLGGSLLLVVALVIIGTRRLLARWHNR